LWPRQSLDHLIRPRQAAVVVAVLIAQGVAMLVFSVATYKRKLWGACGLSVVVFSSGRCG
jgi:hypothetical protein